MNHYETLGVKPDASIDEIRKAYRRKARKAHPDRNGGSGADMSEINVAYETLSDPQRRIHYDATGQNHVTDIVAKANAHLMAKAMQWVSTIAQGDMVDFIRKSLSFDLANMRQNHQRGSELIERMEGVLRKVKYKGSENNLIKLVIEQNIDSIRQQRNSVAADFDAVKKALELIDDYEYLDDTFANSIFSISFGR